MTLPTEMTATSTSAGKSSHILLKNETQMNIASAPSLVVLVGIVFIFTLSSRVTLSSTPSMEVKVTLR